MQSNILIDDKLSLVNADLRLGFENVIIIALVSLKSNNINYESFCKVKSTKNDKLSLVSADLCLGLEGVIIIRVVLQKSQNVILSKGLLLH